jgi:hypothetical protein
MNTLKHQVARVNYKFNYLRKLNSNNTYYNKFLLVNGFDLQTHPLHLYAKTIRLKRFGFR